MYLKETGWDGEGYIHWAQNRYRLQVDVNMIINFDIHRSVDHNIFL